MVFIIIGDGVWVLGVILNKIGLIFINVYLFEFWWFGKFRMVLLFVNGSIFKDSGFLFSCDEF